MTGPRHIYAKPYRLGCNYFHSSVTKLISLARIGESQELLQNSFTDEELRIYQQKRLKSSRKLQDQWLSVRKF